LIGAVWGAVFGYAGHAATRGRRDFSSQRSLTAMRYDVIARGGHADEARDDGAPAHVEVLAVVLHLAVVGALGLAVGAGAVGEALGEAALAVDGKSINF